jgi:N-acetylmuramoyl-L-alanine amidase
MYGRRRFLHGLAAGAAASLVPAAAWAAPRPVTERSFVVVLDPGHGGDNLGCRGTTGVLEKDVVLRLAQTTQAALASLLPHAEVVLTRERDATLPLADRVAFANDRGADLFISVHANASVGRDQAGFETFILDVGASSDDAAATARRENADGPRLAGPRDDVATMVRELALVTNRTRAASFARAIQREQAARFPARLDRGVRQAPFDVLFGARMPAVLFEAGFLDHPDEGVWLSDPGAGEGVARGLAQAVVDYYRDVGRRG